MIDFSNLPSLSLDTRGALHPRSGTADGNPDQKSEGDPVGFLAKAISFNLHSFPLYPCYS